MFSWSEECMCCEQPIGDQHVAHWPMRGQGVSWGSVVVHHGPSDHTSGHWLVVNELSRKSMTGVKNPVYFCRASMSSHGTCAGELSTNCEGKLASLDKQQQKSCQHTKKYIWYKNISAEWARALAAQTRRVAAMTSARVPHPQVQIGILVTATVPWFWGLRTGLVNKLWRELWTYHDDFNLQPPRHTGAATRWRGGQRRGEAGSPDPGTSNRRKTRDTRPGQTVSHTVTQYIEKYREKSNWKTLLAALYTPG